MIHRDLEYLLFPKYVILTSVYRDQENSYHKYNKAIDFIPLWINYPKKINTKDLDLMFLKYLDESFNGGIGYNPKGKCKHIHLDNRKNKKLWKEITIDNNKKCINNFIIKKLDLSNVKYDREFFKYLVPIQETIDLSNNMSLIESIKSKYNKETNIFLPLIFILTLFYFWIINYGRK